MRTWPNRGRTGTTRASCARQRLNGQLRAGDVGRARVQRPSCGSRAASRAPSASSIGGANPDSEVSTSPATACFDSLRPSICGADARSCARGIRDRHGQLGEHRRDPVVVDAALAAAGAPTPAPACADTSGRRVSPRARSSSRKPPVIDRQHDVVDGAAERGANRLDVAQAHRAPSPSAGAARSGRSATRTATGAPSAAELTIAAPQSRAPARALRAARAARRAKLSAAAARVDRLCDQRAREQLGVARLGAGSQASAGGGAGSRSSSNMHRHQIGRGDAVDHAVMDLREQRPAALARSPRPSRSPRAACCGRGAGRHDARRHAAQLLVAAGLRERGVAQVVVEVEVRVVHPHRAAQRRAGRSAPSGGSGARGRACPRPSRSSSLERRGRALEDAHPADVHRAVIGPLDVQERGVHRAHPVHAGSLPRRGSPRARGRPPRFTDMPQWLDETSMWRALGSRHARQSTIPSLREYIATARPPASGARGPRGRRRSTRRRAHPLENMPGSRGRRAAPPSAPPGAPRDRRRAGRAPASPASRAC